MHDTHFRDTGADAYALPVSVQTSRIDSARLLNVIDLPELRGGPRRQSVAIYWHERRRRASSDRRSRKSGKTVIADNWQAIR